MTRAARIGCATAVLLAGLVYLNALNNPFIYDDYRTIIDNGSIVDLTDVRAIVLHDVSRPIVNLSYAIDRWLWGPEPFGFHVTSVVLHMINVALLFGLAWRAVGDWEGGLGNGRATGAPLRPLVVAQVAALLFAVHPMMSEAVAYVSGRPEVLCGTWFLVALFAARRWMIAGGVRWWVLSVVCWLAALLTKEIAVMFPLVLLGYDWLVLDDGAAERRRRLWRLHGPLFGLAAIGGGIRLAAFLFLEHPDDVSIEWRLVLTELNVTGRYLGLMLRPAGQAIFHDVQPIARLLSVEAWWGAGLVAMLLAVVWQVRRVNALISLGVLWFLFLLAPAAALVVLGHGEGMAEHRVYLASAGLFLAAGAIAGWVVARLVPAAEPVPWMGVALLVAALLPLGARTLLRNAVWSSAVTVWTEAAALAPEHPVPRTVLAESLQIAGRRAEAIEAYQIALQLDPLEDSTYLKLGMCLAEVGRLEEAVEVFEALRQVVPDSPFVSIGPGIVAMIAGDEGTAREQFRLTIERHPRDIMARQWLAVLEEEVAANPAEALRLCEEVRQIAPGRLSDDECVRRNRARLEALSAGSL